MLQQLSHWLDRADRRRTLAAFARLDHRLLADIGVPEDRLEEFADPEARARIDDRARGRLFPDTCWRQRTVASQEAGGCQFAGARERNAVLVENV